MQPENLFKSSVFGLNSFGLVLVCRGSTAVGSIAIANLKTGAVYQQAKEGGNIIPVWAARNSFIEIMIKIR
jgi:hypothetical protein